MMGISSMEMGAATTAQLRAAGIASMSPMDRVYASSCVETASSTTILAKNVMTLTLKMETDAATSARKNPTGTVKDSQANASSLLVETPTSIYSALNSAMMGTPTVETAAQASARKKSATSALDLRAKPPPVSTFTVETTLQNPSTGRPAMTGTSLLETAVMQPVQLKWASSATTETLPALQSAMKSVEMGSTMASTNVMTETSSQEMAATQTAMSSRDTSALEEAPPSTTLAMRSVGMGGTLASMSVMTEIWLMAMAVMILAT